MQDAEYESDDAESALNWLNHRVAFE